MKIKFYLQAVFVLCCCTFAKICCQAQASTGSCNVSINRTGNNSLEFCTCGPTQRCPQLTCFNRNDQECLQLVQENVDLPGLDDIVDCNWVVRGANQQPVLRYCFSNCSSLSDTSGCISAEMSPCPGIERSRNIETFVIINCVTSTPTTIPLSVVTPTTTHTTRTGTPTSTSISKQDQTSLLLETSVNPTSESPPSVTRENIAPTSTLQPVPGHITSTVQQQGQTTTFLTIAATTRNEISTTATVPHQSTTVADNIVISPTTTTLTVVTLLTTTLPSQSPIITTSALPDLNTPSTIPTADVSATENPTTSSIMTTPTPALPPTMSTQETTQASTVLDTTDGVSTTDSNPPSTPPKTKAEGQTLSPLALALISVFGGLSVVIALATAVTLMLIICSRKKQKSYIVRNGPSRPAEPVYSEVLPDQPHLYESMTRYKLPSYSQYKKRRFPRKAGNPTTNTVQIRISDTAQEVTPGTPPQPTTSNGTAEAHLSLSGLSQGSNLQVDLYVPNPYETPVSSLGDLRDHEGYARVRDSNSTASPAIGQISHHGYSDVTPITRSYSLGDVRNGYVNVRNHDAHDRRIYESIRAPTKVVYRSKGYVNVRKYHVLSRSYSLDDIRNRPYVNVRPPSPIGDLKLGGYTDASSKKQRPRSYESPVGSMENINNGGYSAVSSPRPRSYESPVLSVASEGRGSTTGGSCCGDEPDEIHTDGGGYSKLDTSLLDGYAILEPYIRGRNNIYSHLQYNI